MIYRSVLILFALAQVLSDVERGVCGLPFQMLLGADKVMCYGQVEDKALKRLSMEGLLKSAKELQAGGGFEGRPTSYALQLYQYYVCSKCNAPYCGGKRDCMRNERWIILNDLDVFSFLIFSSLFCFTCKQTSYCISN